MSSAPVSEGHPPPPLGRVLVTRPIDEAGLARLRSACHLVVGSGRQPPTPDELRVAALGCSGILSLLTERIDASVMDAAGPGLRVISNLAVGVDNVDVAEATRRGIPVGHTPDVLTETTADLAWALLMAAARRIGEGDCYVRGGSWHAWDPQLLLGTDVFGTTLGIIGLGRIGRAVARRARGFSMHVLYHSPRPLTPEEDEGAEWVDLDTLLTTSDFVSVHVPLTPETHGLIGTAALARMRPEAILVNTARGPILDSVALFEALSSGRIAAAALDVTDPEPLPPDSPLLTLPNCLIVPHIGSATRQTRRRMAELAAENLVAGLRGLPLPHCVNPDARQGAS